VLAEGTLIVAGSQGDVVARKRGAKVVGRDGIEPPTPGFSDRPAAARKYAEALYRPASRVSARSAVAALALLAGPSLTACSSPPPAPPRQSVVAETSVSTRYYPVRGTTTPAIFAAIDANGLVETSGQRALGLTSTEWKVNSGDVDVRAVPCVFPSLTVTLHLVVMLPRHETPDDLPADLRDRWERFVARVAAHEQRHVDIYLEGARAMKARLEATRTAVSCADLEKAIDAAWRAQQADIERAQAEFHAEDATRARSRCRPGSTAPARNSSPWTRRSAASTPISPTSGVRSTPGVRTSSRSTTASPDGVARSQGSTTDSSRTPMA